MMMMMMMMMTTMMMMMMMMMTMMMVIVMVVVAIIIIISTFLGQVPTEQTRIAVHRVVHLACTVPGLICNQTDFNNHSRTRFCYVRDLLMKCHLL
jgi:hypothetical protein